MYKSVEIIITDEYYDDAQLLVRSFFSGVSVKRITGTGEYVSSDEGKIFFTNDDTLIINGDFFVQGSDYDALSRGEQHDIFKRGFYEALVEFTGRTLPWGFLTGVRPAKRAMELIKAGKGEANEEVIINEFSRKYMTSEKKARLALSVAQNETEVLARYGISLDYGKKKGFSVYVGIPFCPTTCLYCSFPSLPLDRCDAELRRDYIKALCYEIREGSEIYRDSLQKKGCACSELRPSSVYIGGGTPTALSALELGEIIDCIRECFITDEATEFCVEAGRPDSITREKLDMLKSKGVNRISVNPQSMNQKTLDIIGRRHTVEDVFKSFEMARNAGFDNINTDIILGLPGEGAKDVKRTVEGIRSLSPESLTVHSLALKRASRLNIDAEYYKDMESENSEEIIELMAELAGELGMRPYYMYRQQQMSGNFENTGYALPGKESLYNIVIMEEVQDILAFGVGASSKFLMGNNRFERAVNVKDVRTYISGAEEMCRRKRDLVLK